MGRPVMYNDGSTTQLALCLLQHSDEVDNGSCIGWTMVFRPVNVLKMAHHTAFIDLGASGRQAVVNISKTIEISVNYSKL